MPLTKIEFEHVKYLIKDTNGNKKLTLDVMLLVRVEFFRIGAFGAEKITVEISIIQRVKKHITPENAPRFSMVSNSPNPLLQFSFSAFSIKATRLEVHASICQKTLAFL